MNVRFLLSIIIVCIFFLNGCATEPAGCTSNASGGSSCGGGSASNGCATRSGPRGFIMTGTCTLPYRTVIDDSEIKLAEAAVSVSKSLNELAQIEKAEMPIVRLPPPINGECIGMGALASIDWTGPVEPLVLRIADASHYRLRVLGQEPAIPVVVSISARDVPLADILRNVSFQAHKKTNIVVYPGSRVVELRYLTQT